MLGTIVAAILLGAVAAFVTCIIFSKETGNEKTAPEVRLTTIQEGARELSQYPSTLGDKIRFLHEAETFLRNESDRLVQLLTSAQDVETFYPQAPWAALLQSALSSIEGTSARASALRTAGRSEEANRLASTAINGLAVGFKETEELKVGRKLPKQGVVGFTLYSDCLWVVVEDDKTPPTLPNTVRNLPVYFTIKGSSQDDPQLVESTKQLVHA